MPGASVAVVVVVVVVVLMVPVDAFMEVPEAVT